MVRPAIATVALLLAAVAATGPSAAAEGPSAITERVSVASDGHQARGLSGRFTAPAISDDGFVVAFDAEGSNLVPNDDNGRVDVFWHNRFAGITELVSVTPDGEQGNGDSQGQAVDHAGETVAFDSTANNFAPGDDNFTHDVFLRRMPTGTLELVSVAVDGGVGDAESFDPSITPTGRYVVFLSQASNLVHHDVNHVRDIFVRDMATQTTELVNLNGDGEVRQQLLVPARSATTPATSPAPRSPTTWFPVTTMTGSTCSGGTGSPVRCNWSPGRDGGLGDVPSSEPAISGDGRYVAFMSLADNLVPGDTNESTDVFVRDMVTGTTERVNVGPGGVQANSATGPACTAARPADHQRRRPLRELRVLRRQPRRRRHKRDIDAFRHDRAPRDDPHEPERNDRRPPIELRHAIDHTEGHGVHLPRHQPRARDTNQCGLSATPASARHLRARLTP